LGALSKREYDNIAKMKRNLFNYIIGQTAFVATSDLYYYEPNNLLHREGRSLPIYKWRFFIN